MSASDLAEIRGVLQQLPTDHDADGEHRPNVGEVFAPEKHAAALAPSTLVVVGARGAGKSFWAGVLGQDATRAFAAEVYPRLGLEKVIVEFGYNGLSSGNSVSKATIDSRVPVGSTHESAVRFWQIVILRAALKAAGSEGGEDTISNLLTRYSDPEEYDAEIRRADQALQKRDQILLVIFDALDTIAREWHRLTTLTDALFEAAWGLRARKSIKAKIFIRPDQLNDEGLNFVELPKIKSGRVELQWARTDLYGLLFSQLAEVEERQKGTAFRRLAQKEGVPVPKKDAARLRDWDASYDEDAQRRLMVRLSGQYMGRGANKGATYPWTYNHLADANGEVTPRSFVKLFVEAAKHNQTAPGQVLTAEGIRHGLREASKTRVEQLALEYRWVKRALAPLAGLKVPCDRAELHHAWKSTRTSEAIFQAAKAEGFLPPFRSARTHEGPLELEIAMVRIGVLAFRPDGRVDIPDLFRIAAKMLKLGGVSLKAKLN